MALEGGGAGIPPFGETVDPDGINEKQRQTFKNLTVAHKSVLLLYSKDPASMELSRKLRPEFSKIFVTSDFNEALNLVSGIRARDGHDVDLIIADADIVSVKLVEAANMRPLLPSSSHLPVIASIMLMDAHNEKTLREELVKVGGCNDIIMAPYKTYEVMDAILNCLRRRRLVEYSYRDLKEHQQKGYPHLSVFEDVQDIDSMIMVGQPGAEQAQGQGQGKKDGQGAQQPATPGKPGTPDRRGGPGGSTSSPRTPGMVRSISSNSGGFGGSAGSGGGGGGGSGRTSPGGTPVVGSPASSMRSRRNPANTKNIKLKKSSLEASGDGEEVEDGACMDEIDDWTEASSLLPPYVKAQRQQLAESPGGTLLNVPKTAGAEEALNARKGVDAQIVARMTAELKEMGLLVPDNTADVVDAYEKSQEVLQKQKAAAQAAMQRSRQSRQGGGGEAITSSVSATHVDNVLESTKRPKWGYGEEITSHAQQLSFDAEMRPYIDRPLPDMKRRQMLTVAGLDKRMASGCWKMISGPKKTKNGPRTLSPVGTVGTQSILSPLCMPRSTGRSHSFEKFPGDSTITGGGSSINTEKIPGSAQGSRQSTGRYPGSSMNTGRATGGAGGAGSRRGSLGNGSLDSTSHSAHGSAGGWSVDGTNTTTDFIILRKLGGTNSRSGATTKDSEIHIPNIAGQNKAKKKGKKILNHLAAKTPIEGQLCKLMELDVDSMQVSAQEKELLKQGKDSEEARDYLHAINCYKRSAKSTKKPHIALFFIACNLYLQGRYLDALKTLGEVIAMSIESIVPHSHNKVVSVPPTSAELFVAFYNRALIYFRLGDDHRGVADLQSALTHDPSSIMTKEKMALALRRLGKFDQAIRITAEIVEMKQDMAKKKKIKEMQAKQLELLRKQDLGVAGGSTSSTHSLVGDLDGMMSENGEGEIGGSQSKMPSAPPSEYGGDDEAAAIREAAALCDDSGSLGKSSLFKVKGAGDPDTPSDGTPRRKKTMNVQRGSVMSQQSSGTAGSGGGYNALQRATKAPFIGNMYVSMKDRITFLHQHGRKEGEDKQNTGTIHTVSLDSFKVMHGFKKNLTESIFIRPTSVQEALAFPPGKRSPEHIRTIMTAIRLVPLFSNVDDRVVQELATVAEFRTFSTKLEILKQNHAATAVGFVLKGKIQVRMEMDAEALAASLQNPNNLILEDIEANAVFGHIDMLFAKPNKTKYNLGDEEALYDDLEPSIPPPPTMTSMKAGALGNSRVDSLFSVDSSDAAAQNVGEDESVGSAMSGDSQMLKDINNFNDMAMTPDGADGAIARASSVGSLSQKYKNKKFVRATSILNQNACSKDGSANDASIAIGGCRPEIFMTYTIHPPCEAVFFPPDDFDRLLVPTVREELFRRLETIRASRIFSTWSYRSHIQLARMGIMQTYRAGEMIIDQGHVPNFLYIVSKGMCKAYKKPNKVDILLRNLGVLKEKALVHDTKYQFHHRLRKTMTQAPEGTVLPFEKGTGFHCTDLEHERYKLELEIKRTEAQIEYLENCTEVSSNASSNFAAELDAEDHTEDGALEEISVLQWPMLFGESSVIQPDGGFSAGRIVADTPVEIFAIHKLQLQTFRLDENFVKLVRNHAIVYPNDTLLVHSLKKKKEWGNCKKEYLREMYTKSVKLAAKVAPAVVGFGCMHEDAFKV